MKVSGNQIKNESLVPFITSSNQKPEVKYHLIQFHFHWGFNIYQGSEHHLNSIKYPLEVLIDQI